MPGPSAIQRVSMRLTGGRGQSGGVMFEGVHGTTGGAEPKGAVSLCGVEMNEGKWTNEQPEHLIGR